VDDKESLPADSNDASDTSGDVESMLPDLPEPEVEKGEEDAGAPPTMELTTAAREARAAAEAKKEEDEEPENAADNSETAADNPMNAADTEAPKPALPMQKSAPFRSLKRRSSGPYFCQRPLSCQSSAGTAAAKAAKPS